MEHTITLRTLLPKIVDDVELVIVDKFSDTDIDRYRLKADCGNSLLRMLARSRVVEGESLLDLTPIVRFMSSEPTIINGTLTTITGTGCIRLIVNPPVPED